MTSLDITSLPRKLNLGCGWDRRDGYLNVDFQEFHEPDLVGDVRDLTTLPTAHFDEVVAQDVLEHLERQDTDVALREWARLLRPGGELIVRIPNVIALARLLSERRSVEDQQTLLQCMYGTQAYTGDYHHTGFTEVTIRVALAAAGFSVASIVAKDEWLFDIVAVRAAGPVTADLDHMAHMDIGTGGPASGAVTAVRSPGGVRGVFGSLGRRLPERLQPRLKRIYGKALAARQ